MDDRNVKMHSSYPSKRNSSDVKENRNSEMPVDEYLKFKTNASARQLKPAPRTN